MFALNQFANQNNYFVSIVNKYFALYVVRVFLIKIVIKGIYAGLVKFFIKKNIEQIRMFQPQANFSNKIRILSSSFYSVILK